MTEKEVKKLPLGCYIVHWKSGGFSLAAMGQMENGQRWLAPTNWLFPAGPDDVYGDWWVKVDKMACIAYKKYGQPGSTPDTVGRL